MMSFLANWRWSNAPDGKHPFEKVVSLSKYGLVAGTTAGVYDSILLSQTATVGQTLNCMAYWVVPLTGMCATFASVAYMSTNIRGQDDKLNYILASFATSGVFHLWQKRTFSSLMFGVILSAASCLKKDSMQKNWEIFRAPRRPQRSTFFYKDFTLMKDPRPWKN